MIQYLIRKPIYISEKQKTEDLYYISFKTCICYRSATTFL